MQNSIRFILLAVLTVCFTSALFAQKERKALNTEDYATKKTDRLTEELSLDEAQAEKVKEIHLKYGKLKQTLRSQDANSDDSKKKSAIRQIHDDQHEEIKAVLTEEQKVKFQDLRKQAHKDGKDHKSRKAFHKEKVKPIMLEQRAKLESKITPEDQATLAQIRIEIDKEKEALKAERKAMKNSSDIKTRPTAEEKEKRKAARMNNPNWIKLAALTEKYKSDIEPLLAEAETQKKALKKEMKSEKGKEHKETKMEMKSERKEDGKNKSAQMENGIDRKYAHFLLMDPAKKSK